MRYRGTDVRGGRCTEVLVRCRQCVLYIAPCYITKVKLHSSCEIEFRRNSSLQAVCDAPIARITGCVLIEDIGRRLPLELLCRLYQGQQGDAIGRALYSCIGVHSRTLRLMCVSQNTCVIIHQKKRKEKRSKLYADR